MIIYRTRRLHKKNNSFYVCLPVRFLRLLGWKVGDDLLMWNNEIDSLCIRSRVKSRSIPEPACPAGLKDRSYFVYP